MQQKFILNVITRRSASENFETFDGDEYGTDSRIWRRSLLSESGRTDPRTLQKEEAAVHFLVGERRQI